VPCPNYPSSPIPQLIIFPLFNKAKVCYQPQDTYYTFLRYYIAFKEGDNPLQFFPQTYKSLSFVIAAE